MWNYRKVIDFGVVVRGDVGEASDRGWSRVNRVGNELPTLHPRIFIDEVQLGQGIGGWL